MWRQARSGRMLRSLPVCRRCISSKNILTSRIAPRLVEASTAPPPRLVLPIIDGEAAILEERLLYSFTCRLLLEDALIHTSYPNRGPSCLVNPPSSRSYRPLKLIGERYLLSKLRSLALAHMLPLNLSPHKLARTALRLGLYDFLRCDSPKLDQTVEQFVKEQEGQVLYRGIPPKVPKVLTDIVYAMMGAFLVDCNYREYRPFKAMEMHLYPIFYWSEVKRSAEALQHICLRHQLTFDFQNSRIGDFYTTRVFVSNRLHGSGSWHGKNAAKDFAALDAINKLPKYMLPDKILGTLYPSEILSS